MLRNDCASSTCSVKVIFTSNWCLDWFLSVVTFGQWIIVATFACFELENNFPEQKLVHHKFRVENNANFNY